MDESVRCECGCKELWYFWDYARCPKCFTEFKKTKKTGELWLRRYNHEQSRYSNWEHYQKIKEVG